MFLSTFVWKAQSRRHLRSVIEHFAELGDVILKDLISHASSKLSNIKNEIGRIKKMTPGIQKFYNRYINYYNDIIQDSKDEQNDITNKYGL